MKRSKQVTTAILLFWTTFLISQDCFTPPDGSTLYVTTDAAYDPPAISGFTTLGPLLSGFWSVESTTGSADLTFSDVSGRTSTFTLQGEGMVTVRNQVTDVSTSMMTECLQTFDVETYTPFVEDNPDLTTACPLDIVLVIDESESIANNMSTDVIRTAIMGMVESLVNTGSQVALVEFDSRARRVALNGSNELQAVDSDLIMALEDYLINDYNPVGNPIQLVGGTNWEDALLKADEIADAELILMLTDGRPTFYITNMGMNGIAGEGIEFDLTALKEAQDIANQIKRSGKHIFVAGLDFPSDVQPIIDISGPDEFVLGTSPTNFLDSDFSLVPPSELVPLFQDIASLCSLEVVPTLSQWSIICLGLLLTIFAVSAVKQHELLLG